MTSFKPPSGCCPAWLGYSFLAVLLFGLWGVQSKWVMQHIPPLANQVLGTPGLAAVALLLWLRAETREGRGSRRRGRGIFFAFLTGILGGLGNITFYDALRQGAKASVVVPLTTLYPMVTVVLALVLLKERINIHQGIGLSLALAAILILGS